MAALNDRIKEMRISRGFTLLDVAEKLGVKEATMQRYESGQIKNIKHKTILSLSDIFHCSPSYLMGWEDEENADSKVTKNSSTCDEVALLESYRSLSEEGKEYIRRTMLMVEDQYPAEDTVHIYRAAMSASDKPGEVVKVPRSTVKRLEDAPEADEI